MTAQSHQQRPKSHRTRIVERVTTKTLRCQDCKQEVPLSDFYISRYKGHKRYEGRCIPCTSEYTKKRFAKVQENGMTYEKVKRLQYTYQLTPDQFIALLEGQEHACRICGASFDDVKACVDHCHDSNLVRGLLCQHCNSMLGHARDNPEILIKGAAYLENFSRDILD